MTDAMNRLTSVKTADNKITTYTYLATGELESVKDPQNHITSYEYDKLGRNTKKIEADGSVTQLTYDISGNVASTIDPANQVKTYSYDNLNQLTDVTLPDNQIHYERDAKGNITLAQDNFTAITYALNSANEVTSVRSYGVGDTSDLPDVTLSFNYDENKNRISMQDTLGADFSYSYDELDRLTSVTNAKSETFDFNFDGLGRLTQINRPGSQTYLSFDNTNFVTQIVHASGGLTRSFYQYTRDQMGNRVTMQDNDGLHQYTYDLKQQLVQTRHPSGFVQSSYHANSFDNESFNYDELGNRTSDQLGTLTYDSNNQKLTEDYKYWYIYDQNGNLLQKQPKDSSKEFYKYSYNSVNQLKKVEVFTGTLAGTKLKEMSFVYDVLGRRVRKSYSDFVDSSKSYVRQFVYDGSEIIHELDGETHVLANYTHSMQRMDDVLSVDITTAGKDAGLAYAAGSFMYLKDALGTVTDIMHSSGTVIQRYTYSSFGKLLMIKDSGGADITATPKLNTAYTYTAREHDKEIDLYYYRARYYDPSVGRFLQKDPFHGIMQLPSTLSSSYIYTLNNPILLADPKGKTPLAAALLVAAIIGGAYGGATASSQGVPFLQGVFRGAVIATVGVAVSAAGAEFLAPMFGKGLVATTVARGLGGGLASMGYAGIQGVKGVGLAFAFVGGFVSGIISTPAVKSASPQSQEIIKEAIDINNNVLLPGNIDENNLYPYIDSIYFEIEDILDNSPIEPNGLPVGPMK